MEMAGGKPDFPWNKMMVSKREFMKKVMEMIRGAPFLLKKMKFMKGRFYYFFILIFFFLIFHF